ncbi:HAD family hydrolase [Nocardia sp. CA-128927]|uniref:HAD family hydrolase n=1 Tax=Nocardia sp. CA-128927 TaxID=3239975 RepID=UPI003D99BFD1
MESAALILDLDGTFYPRSNPLTARIDALVAGLFDDYVARHQGGLRELERKFPCVLDGLVEANIERDRFYRTVYDRISYDDCLYPDPALRAAFEVLRIPKFIVSLSPVRHIRRVLQYLAIGDLFDSIVSLEELSINSKGPVYGDIIRAGNMPAQSVVVAGDNYEVDLAPALHLGCRVVQIGDATSPGDVARVGSIHDLLRMI